MSLRWVLILTVLVAVLATEGLLRLAGFGDPPLAVRDDALEYRLVPNRSYTRWGNRIQINSHGFRTSDHSEKIPPEEVRLLLIGDSVVYGNHFLDQEETIAARLSAALSSPNCLVRVIPMAVSSWGPINQEAALARHGTFNAAEIALVLSGHDIADTPEPGGSLVPYRLSPSKSAIGDVAYTVYERLFPPISAAEPGPFEERMRASLRALDLILERAIAAEANLLLVYNATVEERRTVMSDGGLRFMDWAKEKSIETLDLGTIPDVTYRDSIHPDADGARRIAEVLANRYAGTLVCGDGG
jgi:hypothetical protein